MGHGSVSQDIVVTQICREMRWTHEEYQNQPHWFVELIAEMMRIDAKEAERKMQK